MLIERTLDIDVLTAARQRVVNIFNSAHQRVYLSFSGGKDSLCLAHIVLSLAGSIDLSKLTVQFVDEEAIFPCVESIVHSWREKFLSAGAGFDWYCLEIRHYSCLNLLENDESFFCWDRYKRNHWVRQPPPFAIRSHPLFNPRKDTYQAFLSRLNDGQNMTGVRVYESLHRRYNFACHKKINRNLTVYNLVQPIYDWHDDDVWLYLRQHDIIIPNAYMFMWQINVSRPRMRISQFFSMDTIGFLAQMSEYYPDLMERVCQREPNAYLVSLYYDSEMFRRRTRKRTTLEQETNLDYKHALIELLSDIPGNFHTEHMRKIAKYYLYRITKIDYLLEYKDYRDLYVALKAGDPKRRSIRAIDIRARFHYANAAASANASLGRKRETTG